MGILKGSPQFTPYETPVAELSLFQQRLPTSNNELNLLVPAGLGDNLWVVSKLWKIAQERDCTFWLPYDEQHRSGDLYRMLGLQYGYMPNLTTKWIWDRPGSPAIPQSGAVISIQPNRHLEHGHRIEKWYPDLEFRNPTEFMECPVKLYKPTAGARKHVVGFMSQTNYMEYGGNLKPAQWARIFRMVEETVGPVLIIAAGVDVDFLKEVLKHFEPSLEPMVNFPLDHVAKALASAELAIGAHAGPLILSNYIGVPTMQFYPRWLASMAGSWELNDAPWDWDYLDNAENAVREGAHIRLLNGEQSPRRNQPIAGPTLAINRATGSKWFQNRKVDDAQSTRPADILPEVQEPLCGLPTGTSAMSDVRDAEYAEAMP